MRRSLPLLMLLAASCGVNKNNFADKYATAYCHMYSECQSAYFNDYYDSVKDCADNFSEYFDSSYYDTCDFDKKSASACLKLIKSVEKSCDFSEVYDDDSCYYVYKC